MPVTQETYFRVSMEDPESIWELVDGTLRARPPMTHSHISAEGELWDVLSPQVKPRGFRLSMNHARCRLPDGQFFVPDLVVLPARMRQRNLGRAEAVEWFDEPLPLVVEVWSPSTGNFDVTTKLPGYQQRGDLEIWLVHPYERTLTAWRRQPDGSYTESHYAGDAVIEPASLPGVQVRLADLFE